MFPQLWIYQLSVRIWQMPSLPQMLITSPFPDCTFSFYFTTNCDFFFFLSVTFFFFFFYFIIIIFCPIVLFMGPDPSALWWWKVIKGYSSTVLDNLPGSSLVYLNWLLFYSGLYLGPDPMASSPTFGPNSPGSDSWHFFRTWLGLLVLTLYPPDSPETDAYPLSFCPWRSPGVPAHGQTSQPPTRGKRKGIVTL